MEGKVSFSMKAYIGFVVDDDTVARVVALVTIGAGGALDRIEIKGIFKYLPQISLHST